MSSRHHVGGVLKELHVSSLRATVGSAAISYSKSDNQLRLPYHALGVIRNDVYRGFSTLHQAPESETVSGRFSGVVAAPVLIDGGGKPV